MMVAKKLKFVGSSLEDIRAFPAAVRRAIGFELDAVQRGLMPSDWKVLQVIGSGVFEVRVHLGGEWRVIYVARFKDAVYVLHAFRKKSQKASRADMEIARQRYAQIGAKS